MVEYLTFNNRFEILNWRSCCRDMGLKYSFEFVNESQASLKRIWNGIGADGHFYNWLIPNTVYGLDISASSLPHDHDYYIGGNDETRSIADSRMLDNMYTLIENNSVWFLKGLRRARAYKYYMAVRFLGAVAFSYKSK